MSGENLPMGLEQLFNEVRKRGLQVGIDDFLALRRAVMMGFGLSSRRALLELCCALWAKCRREVDLLELLFNTYVKGEWALPVQHGATSRDQDLGTGEAAGAPDDQPQSMTMERGMRGAPEVCPICFRSESLPDVTMERAQPHFVLLPQYPLSYRGVAQVFRRLRQTIHEGPPTELDVSATIARRCRSGVFTSVSLIQRERKRSRLLILVDRYGSMAPFGRFVQEVVDAIKQAGGFGSTEVFYFHDVPSEGGPGVECDLSSEVGRRPSPKLDSIVKTILPLRDGQLFRDAYLCDAVAWQDIVAMSNSVRMVIIVSDAGAARRMYDFRRLVETGAFLRALSNGETRIVWLNPVPERSWKNTTASQIARHVPMFSLTPFGLVRSVDVLRGQHYRVEMPL